MQHFSEKLSLSHFKKTEFIKKTEFSECCTQCRIPSFEEKKGAAALLIDRIYIQKECGDEKCGGILFVKKYWFLIQDS